MGLCRPRVRTTLDGYEGMATYSFEQFWDDWQQVDASRSSYAPLFSPTERAALHFKEQLGDGAEAANRHEIFMCVAQYIITHRDSFAAPSADGGVDFPADCAERIFRYAIDHDVRSVFEMPRPRRFLHS